MINRRRFLLAGIGGATLMTGGCGTGSVAKSTPIPVSGTPSALIPGFDDPHRWAGRTVRVGAFGGEVQAALNAALWQPFAAATGCIVEGVTTDYSRLAEAVAERRPYADVLLIDAIWAESPQAAASLQPLRLGEIAPAAVAAFGGGDLSVPAFAYALVSAYRRDAISARTPPATWREWWDVRTFPGPRALARTPFGTFEFALIAAGVPPDTLYPLDSARAIEQLKKISGKVIDRWWDSGVEPVSWLGSDRADFASAWHYRVAGGQRDGLAVDLVWNQGLVVADRWGIPVFAREPEIGLDLVRYALTAEAQAALARLIPLGPVNPAALALLEPQVIAMVPTAPANLPQLFRPDMAWWAANRGEATQRFNAWLLGKPGA